MIIIGCIVVIVSVITGFTMAGGHLHTLIHLSEVVTIGGAALGALIIGSPRKVLMDLIRALVQVFKGSPYSRLTYIELFKFFYVLARFTTRDGLVALEPHIHEPGESTLFKRYPRIGGNHHVTDFLCTALTLVLDGKVEPATLAACLDDEIKVIEREHHAAVTTLSKTADALPGFGIVAAVLGIVVTMQAIGGPVTEIGHKVGAALVGTFLGILMSYGFIAPMATRMEFQGEEEMTFFRTMAAAVVAVGQGNRPRDVVMTARRNVGTEFRPSQAELQQIFSEPENL